MIGGSLCTGAGGLDLGLERALDIEWAWHCEPDPACRRILDARWPGVANLGDLLAVEWETVEPVDLVAAGFPCFAAGTLILTRDGYREIETLADGDEVLTHKGRWRKISTKHETPDAPLRRIRSVGVDLTCTDDHPFYARLATYDGGRQLAAPEWTEAKDLRDEHFLGQTLPQVERGDADCHAPLLRLVGRYLADGWMVDRKGRDDGRVVICCARDEEDELAEMIADGGYHGTRSRERTVTKYHITRADLYRFVQQFGRHAHGKTLPGWVYSLDRDCAEALLDGYLSGDGHRDETNHCWRSSTVSPKLAYGIALLAKRARGVVASVHRYERPEGRRIEGRLVKERPCYEVHIPFGNRSCFVEGDYGWKKVKHNERLADRATVYNIAVEEDESYVANGAVVHNCPDYSLAGKRTGIGGDHGQVWFGVFAALRALRPRYVVLENVPGIRTAAGLRLDAGESALGVVLADLASLGYRWAYDCMRAADVGAPHGRDRWFCVARLADGDAGGPDDASAVAVAVAVGVGVDADGRVRGGAAGAPRPGRPAPPPLASGPEVDGAEDAVADGGGAASDPVGVGLDGGGGRDEAAAPVDGEDGGGSLRDLPRILEAPADADRGRREQYDEGERRVPLARPRDAPHRLIPTPTESDADSSSGRDPAWGHGLTLTDFARGAREDTRRLLPTPTAEDGERGRAGAGSDRLGAATFDDPGDVRLLPTPQAADGDGGRMEKGAMRRGGKRPSGHKGTLTLGTAVDLREEIAERPFAAVAEGEQAALFATAAAEVALLPTPVANPENPGAGGELRAAVVHGEGRRNETGVDTLGRPNRGRPSRLLPTPTTQDGENTAGPSQRRRHSDPLNVVAADVVLFPTPTRADGDRTSEQGPRHYIDGDDNPTLLGAARRADVEWGVYEGAVRRWEEVSGYPAPAPTDEKGRLDPPFVEWMLGYPEGWFDVPDVSRTAKFRALGNSVQVQVGEVVGLWLVGLVDSGLLS